MPRGWTDPLVHPKQWKSDMRFDTWNVRSLYWSGSLTTAAGELARYKLDLVGVQEVRWDKGDTVRTGDQLFFYMKKEAKIIN
jgi:exonuclease III